MEVTLEAHVINMGKYNEGVLVDTHIQFPATKEEVQAALKRIGVDGIRYQEVILTEHDSNLSGFCHCITQYDRVDELNYLVHLLSALSPDELTIFQGVIDYGEHDHGVGELINLALNLECYELHPGVNSDEELGRIYIDDMELLEVPEAVLPYFDFEAYGRDMRLNEGGHFVDGGYMTKNPGSIEERYHGLEDIPTEYRVFAYPKLNIRERLAAYTDLSGRTATEPGRTAPEQSHDNR